MTRSYRAFVAASCACGVFLFASAAHGQALLSPRISHIMPMGGQAGTTFELRVTGQDLPEAEGLHFSFPGTKVEVLSSEKTTTVAMKGKPPTPLTTHKFTVTLPADAPLG